MKPVPSTDAATDFAATMAVAAETPDLDMRVQPWTRRQPSAPTAADWKNSREALIAA